MTSKYFCRFAVALLLALSIGAASAQDAQKDKGPQSRPEHRDGGPGILSLLPGDSVTQHAIDTPKGKLSYTATAGNRPLTFVFNGGPGAASAFLHLGLVGPRVLELGPNAHDAARAELHDNPNTWLAFTDLVLIDPIGTGWSRAAKSDGAKQFWSVSSDADAMAKAIALYVVHNNRSASAKYLLGESYGGLRAAKTARALQRDQGIVVSGIVMLSPLLEGWLTFGDDGSALRAALQLPSLAAAELERTHTFTLEALLAAEKFVMTDYLSTMAGRPPP